MIGGCQLHIVSSRVRRGINRGCWCQEGFRVEEKRQILKLPKPIIEGFIIYGGGEEHF